MRAPRAIVLSFERLSRRCLGCYGHEWIETPNLDQLATRAVVFDQHFVSPDATALVSLQLAGLETITLTETPTDPVIDSEQLDDTPFAKLIALADRTLGQLAAQADHPWLLWLNAAGIAWPCVATEEFAALYSDELENDGPIESIDPLKLAEVAYAACVTQLDHLVGRLLASIQQQFGDHPPLLIVTARSGESLGEVEPLPLSHTDTAPPESAWQLRDELVHTPLLIANANSELIGSRRMELVQMTDLLPTLRDWFATIRTDNSEQQTASRSLLPLSLLPLLQNEEVVWRDSVVLRDDDRNAALRTSEFLFVQQDIDLTLESDRHSQEADNDEKPNRLYFKPEDVWELNDVADQHREQACLMRDNLRNLLLRKTDQSK